MYTYIYIYTDAYMCGLVNVYDSHPEPHVHTDILYCLMDSAGEEASMPRQTVHLVLPHRPGRCDS